MKIIHIFFYRIQQLMISVGNADVADEFAVLLMTLTLFINIITVAMFIHIFSNLKLSPPTRPAFYLTLTTSLTIFLYLSTAYKKKHQSTTRFFVHESKMQKDKGEVLAIGYIIVSFLLLALSFYLANLKNCGRLEIFN